MLRGATRVSITKPPFAGTSSPGGKRYVESGMGGAAPRLLLVGALLAVVHGPLDYE